MSRIPAMAERAPVPDSNDDPIGPTLALACIALALAYLAATSGADLNEPTSAATLAIGVPALAACALLAARHPLLTATAAIAAMAFSGAVAARYALPIESVITLLLAGLVAGTVIGYAFAARSKAVLVVPAVILVSAYLLYAASQIPFAETPTLGMRAFMAGPVYLMLILGLAYAPWEPETRWKVAKAIVVVSLLAGLYALHQELVGPSRDEVSGARRSAGVGGDLALFGSLPNRVELGSWSAIAAPMLTALALATRGRWRIATASALALTLLALLGSQVRTAFVAAIVGMVIVLALMHLSRSFGAAQLGATVVAVAGLLLAGSIGYAVTVADSPEKTQRFERILDPGSDFSFQQRVDKWEQAVREINREPLGQGLGTAGTVQRNHARYQRLDNKFVDNSWLEVGLQLGYPGVLLLLVAVLGVLYAVVRGALSTADRRNAAIGLGAAGAGAAWLVNMMTGGTYESWGAVLLWFVLGLALAPFVSVEGDRAKSAA